MHSKKESIDNKLQNPNPYGAAASPATLVASPTTYTIPAASAETSGVTSTRVLAASASAAASAVKNMVDIKNSSEASAMDMSSDDNTMQQFAKQVEEELRGAPRVFWVAYQGYTAAVKTTLEGNHGAIIFLLNPKLHLDLLTTAVLGNKLATVRYLLEFNAKQNPANKVTKSVMLAYLNACLTWGNTEIISEFLNYGVPVDVRVSTVIPNDTIKEGLRFFSFKANPNALHFFSGMGGTIGDATALMFLSLKGNSKAVQLLLDRGADILSVILAKDDSFTKSPVFYFAVCSRDIDTLSALSNKLDSPSYAQSVHLKRIKNFVLCEICYQGFPESLEYFVQREKQRIFTELDVEAYEISVLVKRDNLVAIIIKALKTYLNVNERKPYLNRLYYFIASFGTVNMMEIFLNEYQNEIDINSYMDDKSSRLSRDLCETEKPTALILAASFGNVDILKLLVNKGANVNQLSIPNFFRSPLEMAFSKSRVIGPNINSNRSEETTVSILYTLLSSGANILNGKRSALHLAYYLKIEKNSKEAHAVIKFFYLWKIATALNITTANASAAAISAPGTNATSTTSSGLDRKKLDELMKMPSINAFINMLINKRAEMDHNGNLYAPFFHEDQSNELDVVRNHLVSMSDRDIFNLIDRLHRGKYNLTQEPSKNDKIICGLLKDILGEKERQEIEAQNRETAAKNIAENGTPAIGSTMPIIMFSAQRVDTTSSSSNNPIASDDFRDRNAAASSTNKIDDKDGKKVDKKKDGPGIH